MPLGRILIYIQLMFHLKKIRLTQWLSNGLGEYDVMNLAGHAEFETTRKFYLAVREDLLKRARLASSQAIDGKLVANLLQQPPNTNTGKPPSDITF